MTTTDAGPRLAPAPETTAGWETVVGLEVHCELATATKLFCGCANAFGAEPNTAICPVCLGLPGSLPVLNRAAVELAMRVGAALHCEIRPSIFHRKNYFYPDMPKDYQVSQYDEPINVDGYLELPDGSRVGIVRAHMEEDTGKTTHIHGVQTRSLGTSGRIHGADHALVDYNRAGVPLVEIVSAPDIRSAEQAKVYVNELRGILVATGVSDARMEEGSLRVDANVSVRRPGAALGTRTEIKNLNSVRSLVRALEYEARRQIGVLEAGGAVRQETRHWNEDEGHTIPLRSKEEAEDYRYFPEPDLVPLAPSASWQAAVRDALPALPAERRAALAAVAGLAPADVAYVVEAGLADLVDEAIGAGLDPRLVLSRATNEVAARGIGPGDADAAAFVATVRLEQDGRLTATQSKQVLARVITGGGDPARVAAELGFEALGADTLSAAVDAAIGANPAEWERFRAGEDKLVGFFVGKVMAATKGKADGKAVTALLRERRAG